MFDLISIGDSVVNTFIPLLDAEIEDSSNSDVRRISMPLGVKVPVGQSVSFVAGNALNNIVGCANLGLKTAVYTHIGNDFNGERIKSRLKEKNVDLRYVKVEQILPSNHHIVLDFKGERTILIYHEPWEYELPDLDRSKWVFFTSLASSYINSSIVDQLAQYLERTGAKLVFSPGTFQIKNGIKKNPKLLSLTETFICNLEEAKLSLGYKDSDNIAIKKLLKGILDLGPRMGIITDGKEGSYGADGENFYELAIFPAEAEETTGAGDAYASGVLSGLFYGKNLPEAMRWGAANAASVIEKIGPNEGLLTYEKMQNKLKENSKIITKELK